MIHRKLLVKIIESQAHGIVK